MKILKSLRRRKPRPANPEKVFRGFVRAIGRLCPEKPETSARPQRSKT
jgi:hypothetical protein